MNKNFNDWYIEACINPSEDQLKKRWAGIEQLSDNVTANDIINLVKLFYNIPVSETFKNTFAETFIEFDMTFSRKHERELAILAGATLAQVSNTNGDFYSFAELLVCAVSFGNRTPAVNDIYMKIREIQLNDMIATREGKKDTNKSTPLSNSKALLKSIENPDIPWGAEISKAMVKYVQSVDAIIDNLQKAVSAIEVSKQIYYEDSQLLWWLTAGWSRDLNCPYKTIDGQRACLIVGKEAAELVTIFPGPYAIEGVLSRMIENCKKNNTSLNFIDVISAVDSEWKMQYNKMYSNNELIDLLPISAAFARSANTASNDEWIAKYTREVCNTIDTIKCLPVQYALQMYFEVLTQTCYQNLKNK